MSEAAGAQWDRWDEGPPGAVRLGSLLVSLLEPEPGDEVGFHRWYERDHFYAGCMVGPWFFAGRRYVATRAHRSRRYPDLSPLLPDVREGSQLALYWIEQDHHAEAERWAVDKVLWLNEHDRMHPRRQSHAGFYDFRWAWQRDADGVPVTLALDHPYPGLVLIAVDQPEGADRAALDAWYREELLPGAFGGSAVASCVAASPRPLPDDAPAYVARAPGLDRRTLLLFFVEDDPLAVWDALFAGHGRTIAARDLGSVVFASPFVPTIPGTDARVRD
jgi:hypothetical protein